MKRLFFICMVFTTAGIVGFLTGIHGSESKRYWHAYLTNFVFWTGLSAGAFLFVPVTNMTKARWARPLKRLGEAFGTFLPVSFILFWVLYLGRREIFPWIERPLPEKEPWLNAGFLFVRDGFGLLLLACLAIALIYHSVRADSDTSEEAKDARSWKAQVVLSPVFGIAYGLVLTVIAFDLMMSLDPHWYSTLFGAYYFVGSFYTGLAAIVLLSFFASGPVKDFLNPRLFHDLGKILFAFCLLTGYFFYSQFLIIWYGNVPEETRYVIERVRSGPWQPLSYAILGAAFLLPLALLLSRKIKMKAASLTVVSILILAGMWLERYILVFPSFWREESLPIGLPEVLITLGYLGLAGLGLSIFLSKAPPLPRSDPLFCEFLERQRSEGGSEK